MADVTGMSYKYYQWKRSKHLIPKAPGPCELCGAVEEWDPKGWWKVRIVADHCHTCGIIRGAICGLCNHRMWLADQALDNFPSKQWGRAKHMTAEELRQNLDDLIYEFGLWADRIGPDVLARYHSLCKC